MAQFKKTTNNSDDEKKKKKSSGGAGFVKVGEGTKRQTMATPLSRPVVNQTAPTLKPGQALNISIPRGYFEAREAERQANAQRNQSSSARWTSRELDALAQSNTKRAEQLAETAYASNDDSRLDELKKVREQAAKFSTAADKKKAEEKAEANAKKATEYADYAKKFDFETKAAEGAKKSGNKVQYVKDNWVKLAAGSPAAKGTKLVYRHLTDDEVKTYNYIFAVKGEKEAQEYLDIMEDTLNQREGSAQFEHLKTLGDADYEIKKPQYGNNHKYLTDKEARTYEYIASTFGQEKADEYLRDKEPELQQRKMDGEVFTPQIDKFGEKLATGVHGLMAGGDQWSQGVKQTFSNDLLSPTGTQYAQGQVLEQLQKQGGGSMAYQAAVTVGNMLPSILISTFVGGGAGLAGWADDIANVAQTAKTAEKFTKMAGALGNAGSKVGSVAMFAGANGNAYAQAKQEGYSEGQARLYGLLVGASEVVMQNLIGGITPLKMRTGNLEKKVLGLDRAWKRAIGLLGVNTLSETIEEEAQLFVEPAFAAMITGKDYDVPELEEILSTALITFLSTGVLEGSTSIAKANSPEAQLISAEAAIEAAIKNFEKKQKKVTATKTTDNSTVSPAASEEAQQANVASNAVAASNPDRTVIDAATSLIMEKQGLDLKTATKRAEIIGKLVAGEKVDNKTINRIEPTNPKTKAIFTELTGVTFPAEHGSIETTYNLYRSAHDVMLQKVEENNTPAPASLNVETAEPVTEAARDVNSMSAAEVLAAARESRTSEQLEDAEKQAAAMMGNLAENGAPRLRYKDFVEAKTARDPEFATLSEEQKQDVYRDYLVKSETIETRDGPLTYQEYVERIENAPIAEKPTREEIDAKWREEVEAQKHRAQNREEHRDAVEEKTEKKESKIPTNLTGTQRAMVDKWGKVLKSYGLKVEWDDSLLEGEPGRRTGNTIQLNPRMLTTEEAVARIVAHEMVHGIKDGTVKKKMVDDIISVLHPENVSLDDKINQYVQMYQEHEDEIHRRALEAGKTDHERVVVTPEYAREEYAGDLMRRTFTDDSLRQKLARSRPGKVNEILNWIEKVASRFTGQDRDEVYQLRQRFVDALGTNKKAAKTEDNAPRSALNMAEDQDSVGFTLSEQQKKFFKNTKMVDRFGRLKTMFHGTRDFGFTVFDPQHSDDKLSLFFTDSIPVARTYTPSQETGLRAISKDTDMSLYEDRDFDMNKPAEAREYLEKLGWEMTTAEILPKEEIEQRAIHYARNTAYELRNWYEALEDMAVSTNSNAFHYWLQNESPLSDKIAVALDSVRKGNAKDAIWNLRSAIREMNYARKRLESLNGWSMSEEEYEGVETMLEPVDDHRFIATHYVMALNEPDDNVIEYSVPGVGEVLVSDESAVWDAKHENAKMRRGVYMTYLNLENPFIVDAGFHQWNQLDYDDIVRETGTEINDTRWFGDRTRDIADWAQRHGYDGVIFQNLVDLGGQSDLENYDEDSAATVAVAFKPEQVKSVFNKEPTNDPDIRYALVEDPETIDFLENQEHITVYKAMVKIDGKYYPPMASEEYVDEVVTDKKGNQKTKRVRKLKNPSIMGRWQQSVENPAAAEKTYDPDKGYSMFKLLKSNKDDIPAAYNPYEHTSSIVLNDQFTTAYKRPELVTVEYRIPVSELTSGYKAQYAKDPVGLTDWKAGGVAQKLQNTHRDVYLTRWSKPVRELSDAEVAQKYKEIMDKEPEVIKIPWNVVTESLRHELEKAGVAIDYSDAPIGSVVYKFEDVFPADYAKLPDAVKQEAAAESDRKAAERQAKAEKKAKKAMRYALETAEEIEKLAIPNDVIFGAKYSELRNNGDIEDYNKAKKGDIDAAARLIEKYVTEDNIAKIAAFGENVYLLPVQNEEGVSDNVIPQILSLHISKATGQPVLQGVFQAEYLSRRSQGTATRLTAPDVLFDITDESVYNVLKGAEVVGIDDNTSYGSTLRGLAKFLQEHGAKMVGSYVLTVGGDNSEAMVVTDTTWESIEKEGIENVEQFARSQGYTDAFTREQLGERRAQDFLALYETYKRRGTQDDRTVRGDREAVSGVHNRAQYASEALSRRETELNTTQASEESGASFMPDTRYALTPEFEDWYREEFGIKKDTKISEKQLQRRLERQQKRIEDAENEKKAAEIIRRAKEDNAELAVQMYTKRKLRQQHQRDQANTDARVRKEREAKKQALKDAKIIADAEKAVTNDAWKMYHERNMRSQHQGDVSKQKELARKRLKLKDEKIAEIREANKERSKLRRNAARTALRDKRRVDAKRAEIEKKQGLVDTIRKMPAERTGVEKVQEAAQKLRVLGRTAYSNFVNMAAEIDRFAKRQISDVRASELVNMVGGAGATVEQIFKTALVNRAGDRVTVNGKELGAMKDVFLCFDAKGKVNESMQALLQDYMLHAHNQDRMSFVPKAEAALSKFEAEHPYIAGLSKESYAKLVAQTDAETEKLRNGDMVKAAREYARLIRARDEAQNVPIFADKNGNAVTAETSKQRCEELLAENPWLEEKAQGIYEWWDAFMRNWAVGDSISLEQYEAMRAKYPHYVPTYRQSETGIGAPVRVGPKSASPGKATQRATGSFREVVNIEDSFTKMVSKIVKLSRTNELYKNMLDTAMLDEDGSFEDMIVFNWDWQDGAYGRDLKEGAFFNGDFDTHIDDNVGAEVTKVGDDYMLSAWYDGAKFSAYISEELFTSIAALSGNIDQGLEKLTQIGNTLTSPMKSMITGNNPIFGLRNVIRDLSTAMINTRVTNSMTGIAFYKYWAQAINEIRTGSDHWHNFVALGGTHSTYYNDAVKPSTALYKEKHLPGKIWEGFGKFNEVTESATRFAEYLATVERLGDTYENRIKGIKNAAEVTVDFSRKGRYGKLINAWVPYWNPAVQGIDKQIRALVEAPEGSTIVKQILKTGGRAMLNTVLLESVLRAILKFTDRDDEWEELDDRTKDAYYCIPLRDQHKFLKIPKSREWSAILGNPFWRLLEYANGRDNPFENYLETSIEASYIPPAIFRLDREHGFTSDIVGLSIALDLARNEDFAGRTIVPSALQQGSLDQQFDEDTSFFAKKIGDLLNFSPMQIDYIIESYCGDFGQLFIEATADATWKGDRTIGDTLYSIAISPWIKDNRYSNYATSAYYDRLGELDKVVQDKKNQLGNDEAKKTKEYQVQQALKELYGNDISDLNKMARELPDGPEKDAVKEQLSQVIAEAIEYYDRAMAGEIKNPILDAEYVQLSDRVSNELIDLDEYKEIYNFAPRDNAPTSYVDPSDSDYEYKFTDEQKDKYMEIYYDLYNEMIAEEMDSSGYRNSNGEEKAGLLLDIKEDVSDLAKEEFLDWLKKQGVRSTLRPGR